MSDMELSYRTTVLDSGNPHYRVRLTIGTPTMGLVRIEWCQARFGQVIPCNWSQVQALAYMNSFIPLRYQVDDAQNMIVRQVVNSDSEWCLLVEDDVCLPPDAFIRFNEYMRKADIPVVSALYYTKSQPSEPLVYRGRGNSFYGDWKPGDLVWCDGVPTGALLIHASILRKMWDESPEYMVGNQVTRKVFETPAKMWFDPQSGQFQTLVGTSDLYWCDRVMSGDYLKKAGWGKFAEEHMPNPFLVDTAIFARHIDQTGVSFP